MSAQGVHERPTETRSGLIAALVLILIGMALVVAGVAVLLGTGYALVTAGLGLTVFALVANLSRVLP